MEKNLKILEKQLSMMSKILHNWDVHLGNLFLQSNLQALGHLWEPMENLQQGDGIQLTFTLFLPMFDL
jgi:hypothetical protein